VNRVRQHYHLPPIHGSLFYVSPYLVLAYTTEVFEYPRPDLPPQVYFVGPSISQQRDDTDVPFPWEWLGEKPIVYVTFGTIKTGRLHWFDRAMEASQGQPWQMVVSVGRYQDPAQWASVPANVLVRNYVPHSTLFRRVQAVVSHGGSNTTAEALTAGIPLAITPAGADNSEVAQRVVEAGAGIRFDMERTSTIGLREIIRRLLEEPAWRENAQRIAQDYARCDGPGTSAALILRLAETRVPLLRPAGQRPTVRAGEIEQAHKGVALCSVSLPRVM
jgi:MGT family glycosyltransferase